MPWLYNLNMNESLYTYYLPNVYSACAIIYHVISKGPVKMSQSSASSCVGEQPAEGDIMERLLKSIKVTFYPQSGWCTFQCTLLHKRLSYGSQNNILIGGFFRLKWNETPNLIGCFCGVIGDCFEPSTHYTWEPGLITTQFTRVYRSRCESRGPCVNQSQPGWDHQITTLEKPN